MPEIIFNGPAGRLEARYTHAKKPDAPLALILHPNPEQGGTMNNKISYMMHQTFVKRGFNVMRFNFRGVGKSQGIFDKGEGELSDAASALDWLQDMNPNAPYVWVSGYQFGAWVGMQLLMRRPEIRGFISVSPQANEYDFSFLAPCPSSGLVVHAQNDDLVPRESVDKMVERLHEQQGISIDYRIIGGANHFYRDKCELLMENVHDHLNKAKSGGDYIDLASVAA